MERSRELLVDKVLYTSGWGKLATFGRGELATQGREVLGASRMSS